MSSAELAVHLRSHPVTIRKTLKSLQDAGLVKTSRGVHGGTTLLRPAASITLAEVYLAVKDGELLHSKESAPNPECSDGIDVQSILQATIEQGEAAMVAHLRGITIADVLLAAQA